MFFLWLIVSLLRFSQLWTGSSSDSTVLAICSLSWLSNTHDNVLSSANRVNLKNGVHCGKSLIWTRNSNGPKIEPCGTPMVIGDRSDEWLLTAVNWYRFDKYDLNHWYVAPLMPYLYNLFNRMSWSTQSKTLLKSIKIERQLFLYLNFRKYAPSCPWQH